MKSTIVCLALAPFVALAAQPATAAIVFTSHPVFTRQTIGDKWVYTFSFTATEPGGLVAGFAGNLSGKNAFRGLLSQQLVGGALPTPTTDLNLAIDESIDSQFLIRNADILSTVAPFETVRSLGGAFTLNIAARAAVKPLVQLVTPINANVCYDFSVTEAVGATFNVTHFFGIFLLDGTPCLPEPSAAALVLIMASLGHALARRKIEPDASAFRLIKSAARR
jgi:hypothetical protein